MLIIKHNHVPSKMWVPVSSTGKVSCHRARDLGSNPVYTKNQWCLGLMVRTIIISGRHRFKCYHNYI